MYHSHTHSRSTSAATGVSCAIFSLAPIIATCAICGCPTRKIRTTAAIVAFLVVGGRDNVRHCHVCGMWIDGSVLQNHNCKTGKFMNNCPVCQEDLFRVARPVMKCPVEHAIHWHCFKEMRCYDTPFGANAVPCGSTMAMSIVLQPMPSEMARLVTVICIDCQ